MKFTPIMYFIIFLSFHLSGCLGLGDSEIEPYLPILGAHFEGTSATIDTTDNFIPGQVYGPILGSPIILVCNPSSQYYNESDCKRYRMRYNCGECNLILDKDQTYIFDCEIDLYEYQVQLNIGPGMYNWNFTDSVFVETAYHLFDEGDFDYEERLQAPNSSIERIYVTLFSSIDDSITHFNFTSESEARELMISWKKEYGRVSIGFKKIK